MELPQGQLSNFAIGGIKETCLFGPRHHSKPSVRGNAGFYRPGSGVSQPSEANVHEVLLMRKPVSDLSEPSPSTLGRNYRVFLGQQTVSNSTTSPRSIILRAGMSCTFLLFTWNILISPNFRYSDG